MRKIPVVFVAGVVALLAGCGDSDDSEGQPTPSAAAVGETVTTTASSGAATSTTGAAAAGSVAVSLADRTLETSPTVKAGSVTFAVRNSSPNNQHEFVVIKGTFTDLPKTSIGGVDESKLAAGALVGRSDKIAGGGSATVTMNLPAGAYVFLCNISSGPTSHAALGQRLDVTAA